MLKKVLFRVVVSIVFALGLLVLVKQPILPEYLSFWGVLTFVSIISIVSVILENENSFGNSDFENKDKRNVIMLTIVILFVFFAANIFNSKLFLSEEYAKALDIQEVNASQINFDKQRAVTKDMAIVKANKVLGEKYEGVQVSSQYELDIDSASVQMVNNELEWVITLDYRGFTKWLKQDYIPGYVTLSATNPRDIAKLHLGYKIKLSPNGYFMSNAKRYAYLKSGFAKIKTHFEINDNGDPYLISLVIEPTVYMSVFKTTKVIVINAQTKEFNIVAFDEVEEKYPWIDRIIDEGVTDEQIEWFGSLQDGIANYYIYGENINEPTSYNGRELWISHVNGRQVFFTGMTSNSSKDQSLVQGIIVDTKTGKGYVFDLSGVMDEAGAVNTLDSALGANSTKWEPVLPQPFMINNEFYWGSSIVSMQGVYQNAGIVNGKDPSRIYFAKDFEGVVKKATLELEVTKEDSNEEGYIRVKKSVLKKILKKLDEIEQLRELL